jgi:hypothetical protein
MMLFKIVSIYHKPEINYMQDGGCIPVYREDWNHDWGMIKGMDEEYLNRYQQSWYF